ncbi:uncharacterized protein KD926_004824 [Aspergillus affinis]|uniref:uncharacterized protein n=1 Tax=Aspergillus affinis TaxID=1070780 RepID=UPI0022FEF221|nr:uncharacterized protein KD926_004824 [Aspergillus affinis]KAI9035010.1 hypothetical protein KD926_004824 [Aspergillus affinis]
MMAAGIDFRLTIMGSDKKAGPVSFRFDDELEPLNEKDYDCAVDLFRTLIAIKRLDGGQKLAIGFYLEAHAQPTSWLLCVNGIVAEIPAGKLVSFGEAITRELSRVNYDKSKVEDKTNETARTYEEASLEKGKE